MKLKRNALIILVLGVAIGLIGLFIRILLPIILVEIYTEQHGSIGIIGGADGPTAVFLTRSLFNRSPEFLILLGVTLVVSAVFCLIFSNTVSNNCSIATSSITLGLSAMGGLGISCFFTWFPIVAFDDMSKHPIRYPLSIAVGLFCLLVFIGLIVLYLKIRKKNWSIKGFIIDVLTSILYLPTFFFGFAYLIERLSLG